MRLQCIGQMNAIEASRIYWKKHYNLSDCRSGAVEYVWTFRYKYTYPSYQLPHTPALCLILELVLDGSVKKRISRILVVKINIKLFALCAYKNSVKY